ncbi:putative transposase of IS4/5 family DUF4096 [Rhodobacter aestuarii]|uniref:Putative transposase of IS4/5 family n=1 Tax=Rhodobacter aestuarii TaxID=453582 RepID=A0A1N7QBP9_9RHOB|nr:putative transposase of IS4/5 family DUF4096 [Rhodobacter aestuarii]SIT19977.1 Putative transposase of IS4/5 family [Rhodobacter aestuarii]
MKLADEGLVDLAGREVEARQVLVGREARGLRWRDAPKEYGPHKTLYSRWMRWSEKGLFARMMARFRK